MILNSSPVTAHEIAADAGERLRSGNTFDLSSVPVGETVIVRTCGSEYHLTRREDRFELWGGRFLSHVPSAVTGLACTLGGSLRIAERIAVGMFMEFVPVGFTTPWKTSRVKSISMRSNA